MQATPNAASRPFALLLFLIAAATFACGGGNEAGGAGSADAASALARGRELAQAGKHAEALDEYRPLMESDDGPDLALAIARSLFALERYGEAGNVLKTAATTHPDHAEVAFTLGTVHLKMNNLDPAARELERATKLDPDSRTAYLYLGRALYDRSILLIGTMAIDQDRLDRAIAAFKRAIELDPDGAEARYRLALAYDRKHDGDAAIAELEIVARRQPGHVAARRMLGRLLVEEGEVKRGAEELNAVLQLAPQDAETHYEMGVALEERDDDVNARKAYETAIGLRPSYGDAYFRLSAVLRRAGEEQAADDAQLYYEHWETKARELDAKRLAAMAAPDDPLKQLELGYALLELERFDEARASLQRSIELNPNVPRARYALGRILMRAKELPAAREQFQLSNQLEPDNPTSLSELGQVCVWMGDFEAARRTYEELVALSPDDVDGHLRLADLLAREKDYQGARAEYLIALELDPVNASATFNLGSLALTEGDRDEARAQWTRTLELDPEHPKAKQFLELLDKPETDEGG